MEIDIKDKEIINQTVNFVRTYHSKQSKLPVVPGPDEEGLKMLARVYTIAKKYRQQEKENHYKDEYGTSTWGGDPEFYRNVNFVLTWCDKFSVFIDGEIESLAKPKAETGPSKAAAKDSRSSQQPTKSKRNSGTDAANKLSALTGIYQELQDKQFIVNGRWTGSAACFWTLVYELNINHEIDNGGLAWVDVARWVGIPADEMDKLIHSAQVGFRANESKKARGRRAAELRIICQK